ncbi:hypothetical protein RE476_03590 [Methanolobus mangrovi]|uniref:Uncharacterized protein n=1 Tax=Methanolobus mangrovi TaxID=3072977 RepID=A0AA51UGR6_9EURY|nr:hypothetical protein [Methanolobus mangrovi]WMW22918.1 hypothetical protein RE476_03590 [Methanolobus mangrovi]
MDKQMKSKDFDESLKEYLSSYGIVKRADILDAFRGERSKRSIVRHLENLKEAGFIEKLSAKQVTKYGIKPKDYREKYFLLKENTEIKNHIDAVFKLFDDGDSEAKIAALGEMDTYSNYYFLEPLQLDILVKNLSEKDIELSYQLMVVIHHYIVDKKIQPSDINLLLTKLRSLLKNIPPMSQQRPVLRGNIIALLCKYNDETVIDQLIKDAETMENFADVKDEYDKLYAAKLIEKNRTKLFNLEIELRNKGKHKNAKVLSQIRDQARKGIDIAVLGGNVNTLRSDLK